MRLSASDLEIQKQRPTRTQLDLFIFKPRVVMQCLINNGSIAKGARTIVYDSVSLGSFNDVEAGMSLLIGTSLGGNEVGKIRIKYVTSSQFVVSENSNIKWQDNLYLTVIRYWDIWPVFPRIIQNPSNPEDVIFYKDYDILYSGQNFKLGTFVNAGPHRPVFLENGTGTAYYSSTGTYNLLGNSLSYDWSFEGGNPSGSMLSDPGNVYYTTPGDYVTRLIVTDNATGIQDKTYRYVSVKNKIGEGSNTPIVKWTMGTLSGSRDEGGYTVEFKVYDPDLQIDENSVIMLRATDWYGANKISIGGNYPNASNIFFVGYIEQGSIKYNAQYSYTSFTVQSITGIMKRVTGFSVSVESTANPSYWYQLRDMDVRRAIYHYLKWHSTVLSVSDFSFIGQDYKIQYFDVDRTSVFDAVDEVLKSALYGRLSADRQGRLWGEVDPLAYSNPTGTFTPVMNITRQDWMNEPGIGERLIDDLSYVEYGGIAYSGAITGTFAALLSGAPGSAPSFAGSVEKKQGFALGGQGQLNQLTGNVHANKSQKYPTVELNMSNQTRNLDIAPQEVVSVRINRDETVRRVEIDGLYIPNQFSWEFNPKTQRLSVNINYAGLVSGNPGDTIIIPPNVDDADFQFPNFSFPPIPDLVLPTLPIIEPASLSNLVVHIKNKGIFYTNDLTSDIPTWYPANINLIDFVSDIRNFEVSADGQVFVQIAGNNLWSASYPGSPWLLVFDKSQIDNPEGFPVFPPGQPAQMLSGFGINRRTGHIFLVAGFIATIFNSNFVYVWTGDASGLTRVSDVNLFIPSSSSRFGWITYGNPDWVYTLNANVIVAASKLLDDGSGYINVIELPGSTNVDSLVSTRAGREGGAVVAKDGDIRLSIDNGLTWSRITGSSVRFGEGFADDRFESVMANEDGTVFVVASSSPFGLAYSLNGGTSWSSGTGSFFAGDATCVWNMGDSLWAFSGDNQILLLDLISSTGTFNKTGNLGNLVTGSFEVIAMRHY